MGAGHTADGHLEAIPIEHKQALIEDDGLQDLIKKNIREEKCQAVLVTGAGISAQLLDREPLLNYPEEERNALIRMVSSWTGLYEHLCNRLVGDRFIETGIKPRMLKMLLCITQLVTVSLLIYC